MAAIGPRPRGVLLDVDGVLHVGEEPIPGAIDAFEELRELADRLRLVTNTTSRPRSQIVARLRGLGFPLEAEEVITPAAMALAHCRRRGHRTVMLAVRDALREDLVGLTEAAPGEVADAVILGDLGPLLSEALLNAAFRALLDGAELIALQHNRYWRSAEGLVLDVGAYSAALEYGAEVEATVVGKPSPDFFASALEALDCDAAASLMVGDDIEADVGGALAAGIRAVLVRTGKYRRDAIRSSAVEPTATIDSIAELPALLRATPT
jgi:HAD superfamily hydrolase (TIGR01458 family)